MCHDPKLLRAFGGVRVPVAPPYEGLCGTSPTRCVSPPGSEPVRAPARYGGGTGAALASDQQRTIVVSEMNRTPEPGAQR